MKKVLAVIPARYESERFPGKLLSKIDGQSVIFRVVSQILKCESIDDVVLATDDERIACEIASQPIDIVYTKNYFRNGTERVASIIQNYQEYDIVINVQGDEPFLSPQGLERLVEELKSNRNSQIVSMRANDRCSDTSLHVVKVQIDEDGVATDFNRVLPANEDSYAHIGIYGFQREVLEIVAGLPFSNLEGERDLEQLRWMENGYKLKMIPVSQSFFSINVPEDILKYEASIRNMD